MSNRTSSHAGAHPYTQLFRWTNGELKYWTNSQLYSDEVKAKLEARVEAMANGTKQIKDFESTSKKHH